MVRRYWRRFFAQGGIRTWTHEPVVRHAVNRRISGSPGIWPVEWFADRFVEHPFGRALSLGCGEGALERDLLTKGLCNEVIGLDISMPALESARRKAQEADWRDVAYRSADLDDLTPRTREL